MKKSLKRILKFNLFIGLATGLLGSFLFYFIVNGDILSVFFYFVGIVIICLVLGSVKDYFELRAINKKSATNTQQQSRSNK